MRGIIVGIMILSGLIIFGIPQATSARNSAEPCTCGCGDLERRITELELKVSQIKECKCDRPVQSQAKPSIIYSEPSQPQCIDGSCQIRQPIIQAAPRTIFRRFRNG